MPLPLKPILTLSLLILFFGSLSQAQVPTYVRPSDHPIPDTLSYREFNLKDGTHFYGRIVGETATDYYIKTNAGLFKIRKTGIRSINTITTKPEEIRANSLAFDRGRGKSAYKSLLGQSAFMMGKHDFNFAQSCYFFTSANYGLTNHIQIGLGTVLPTLLFVAPIITFNFKVGLPITPKFRLAAGSQSITLPYSPSFIGWRFFASLFYTMASYGTKERHISGGFYTAYSEQSFTHSALPTFSGAWQITPSSSLLTETVLYQQFQRLHFANFGIRISPPRRRTRWDFFISYTTPINDHNNNNNLIPIINYCRNY